MAQETQNKCTCTKNVKALEKKVANLETQVNVLLKKIEVLKRALNSKGV